VTSSEHEGPGFALVDPVLSEVVQDGLAEVERNLHDVVQSEFHPVTETSLHLVEAGGKRIRPLFTLLASQFGADWDREKVIKAATVVELTHLATLYHDDVMDEATMRRGAVSANVKWDNSIAILTGDFLFAHASRLTADLGTDAARIIAETFSVLVTGQMRETVGPQPGEDPISHYLTVIEEKTGVLIATAARFGGMFSDGTDLREGVKTLPMLYALADPSETRLAELLAGPITEDALVDEALSLLRKSSGMDKARETLDEYADRARTELGKLPPCAARDALDELATYCVARSR
jgi:heptaprenyl diphosphate synthase